MATPNYSERAVEALLIYLQGATYEEIGKHYGITRQRAYALTERACRRFFYNPDHINECVPANMVKSVKAHIKRVRNNNGWTTSAKNPAFKKFFKRHKRAGKRAKPREIKWEFTSSPKTADEPTGISSTP